MKESVIEKDVINYVDRKTAAKLLNISTRTLDRYLRNKKLSSKRKNHRILVKKTDIDNFINTYKVDDSFDLSEKYDVKVREKRFEEQEERKNKEENHFMASLSKTETGQNIANVYKNLYTEFKKDLEKKDAKLEMAHYRIGQLETEIKQMMPKLEHNKKSQGHELEMLNVQKTLEGLSEKNNKLKKDLKGEKINKIVSFAILAILLLAVPLMIFFSTL